jgi:hypothetical protein
MKKLAFAMGLGVVLASSAPVFADPVTDGFERWTLYSDDTIACIADDADVNLNAGQYEYLAILLHGNLGDRITARRDTGISVAEALQVQAFLAIDPTRCVFAS